jgi:hypothetical protein
VLVLRRVCRQRGWFLFPLTWVEGKEMGSWW